MVPNPDMANSPSPSQGDSYPSNSYSGVSPLSVETKSPTRPAPPSRYTPPPSKPSKPSDDYYQDMPYSSFTGGGYSKMDCGYGYKKGYDGKCNPEDWVRPPFFFWPEEPVDRVVWNLC